MPQTVSATRQLPFSGTVTPPTITANVSDFSATGLTTALFWRQDTDVDDWTIRGLTGGVNDRIFIARNAGSSRIILTHEDAGATDVNRFTIHGNRSLLWMPGQTIILAYISSRWRIAGTHYQARISTPLQITANQNDYLATDSATGFTAFHCDTLRLSSDALRNITGLAGGFAGRVITVINVGSFDIRLLDENTGSVAANRFSFNGNFLTLHPGESIDLIYDGTTARYRSVQSFRISRVRKITDESRTSNVTNSADGALLTPTLAANTDYYLKVFLSVTGTAATGGIKGQFDIPAGASLCGNWVNSTATANVNQPTNANVTLSTAANQDPLQTHVFEGVIRIAGTAGTVTWSWSQATSAASAVTIKAGSYMELRKLP